MEKKPPIEIEFSKTKPENSLKSQLENVDSTLLEEDKRAETESIPTKLRKQLEFYFGDSNLHNDKFLLSLLRQNEKGFIDLTIFLNFNKVKKLWNEEIPNEEKLSALKQAISLSNLLKLNKTQTKVCRRIPFNIAQHNDNRVVYVENLPEKINHEVLARIFSKIGEVLHVSLPKYTETQMPKGFAFVEFKTEENAKLAVEKYNNCIPAEFLTQETKGKLLPLNVILKVKWLEMKEEYKNLRQKLFTMVGKQAFEPQKDIEDYKENEEASFVEKKIERKDGCLVQIKNLEKLIGKQDIHVALRHVCEPAYIDYRKGSDNCVVRFENKAKRDDFIEKCLVSPLKISKNIVFAEKIEGENENKYWDEINKKKNAFRHYLFNKKLHHSKKIKK